MTLSDSEMIRFRRFVQRMPSGCDLWIGNKVVGDYGRFFLRGRQELAHRVAYEDAKGSIPFGLTIDHLCRRPACVNPEHLEAVTQAENNHRANLGWWWGDRGTCVNGHEFTESNTRIRLKPTPARICRTCARERTRDYRIRKAQAA